MILFNLAVADAMIRYVILPSHTLLLAALLLGKIGVRQRSAQIFLEDLQNFVSSVSFHGVLILTIQRRISVIHCVKCTVIMTKARELVASLTD